MGPQALPGEQRIDPGLGDRALAGPGPVEAWREGHDRGRLRGRHGIVTSQYEFLLYLRDHPGSRVADLAVEFAVGIGATSKGVDRLERNGWVAREPNPADRRSSLLVLTGEGMRLVNAAEVSFTEGLTELIGDAVSESSVVAAAKMLGVLRAALERDQVGLPTG